jgi:diguanylate cyclase (GGDEF)-like protein
MRVKLKISDRIFTSTIILATLVALIFAIRFNFLLFHVLAELFTVVIAFGIFTIAWNAKKYIENHYFLLIGVSFLFIGVVDLFHTITYKGMNVIPGYGADLPTQFWVISKYMEGAAFLAAPFFIRRRMKVGLFLSLMAVCTAGLMGLCFARMFPSCYLPGEGLTPFKKASEYVISAMLVASVVLLKLNKKSFEEKIYRLLVLSIASTVLSEVTFTLYVSVYGLVNVAGHFFNFVAFYLFYLAIIQTGIVRPFELIFRELKKNEDKLSVMALTDDLTGLFNRRGCYESLRRMMARSKRRGGAFAVCLIDIDNMKEINDRFGHSEGDRVLGSFADIIRKNTRESDYACRIGGDEFVLLFPDGDAREAEHYLYRILSGVDMLNTENMKYAVTFSYGLAEFNDASDYSIDRLIETADKNMYRKKSAKKSMDRRDTRRPSRLRNPA